MQNFKRRRTALENLKIKQNITKSIHPIYTFRKTSDEYYKRCQSVLIKRRDWYTSSNKIVNQDERLDLNKKSFGPEYRQMLDKYKKMILSISYFCNL